MYHHTRSIAQKFGMYSTLLLCISWFTLPLVAQDEDAPRAKYIRANYSKFEYRIPMRDGTRLFTAVYIPNDRSKTYPFLMLRTPYTAGPYGADRYRQQLGPSEEFEKEGFIFVIQDVRGRFMSEGTFDNMRPHIARKSGQQFDENSDTFDTIDWLLEHVDGHNGRVGQWGISYPGFYTSAGVIDSHPALKAVSPQAPIADWFWDDMHHHGAFILPLTFNFFSGFGVPRPEPTTKWPERFEHGTPDGYQFFLDLGPLSNVNERHFHGEIAFWNEIVAHPNYDEFWQARNIVPHLKNIRAAVLVVGGWFDTEDLYGPLATYAAIEKNNPQTFNALVMGPWTHGQWNRDDGSQVGSAEWGFATSDYFRHQIQLPFFLQHLKDGPPAEIAEATVFETGANRWRQFSEWPPETVKPRQLLLQASSHLALNEASANQQPARSGDSMEPEFDEFISDPAKPVPYTMEITTGWAKDYITEDQRFAAWRPDVLLYRSPPLEEDLTVAGPIQADLWVSTSQDDADWIVKVIDEFPGTLPGFSSKEGEKAEISNYPGGRQMLVRAEVIRGRFREDYSKPKPFEPNQPTHVSYQLHDVLHTFKRGHRITVHIQSTWFPFVDRNPQRWVDNIFAAQAEDYVKANHRVYRSRQFPSCLRLNVLP